MEPRRHDDPWREASWAGSEGETLEAGAAMSLPQRLLWLERMAAIARTVAASGTVDDPSSRVDAVAEPSGAGAVPSEARSSLTLLELLDRLGGARLEGRYEDALIVAALVRLAGGRQLLVVERTYRDGIRVLLDPGPTEIEAAQTSRLWDLWNSDRALLLTGAT